MTPVTQEEMAECCHGYITVDIWPPNSQDLNRFYLNMKRFSERGQRTRP